MQVTTSDRSEPLMSMDMNPSDDTRADTEIDRKDNAEDLQDDGQNTEAVPRVEDSGLHDIRSLAQSAKMRLSKQIIAPTPPDDIIASSSGGWKAVALPEPAKMISLPELAELPSKKDIKAAQKAAKAEAKEAKEAEARESKKDIPIASLDAKRAEKADKKAAAAVEASASVSAAPVIGSRLAQPKTGGNGKLIAGIGLGVAAAAGITFFVVTQTGKKSEPEKPKQVAIASTPIEPEKKAEPAAMPPPPEAPKDQVAQEAKADEKPTESDKNPELGTAVAADAKVAAKTPTKAMTKSAAGAGAKSEDEKPETTVTKTESKKPEEKKAKAGAGSGSGEAEPSFDELLNEAGVSKEKKVEAPKLEKKSLDAGDFKKGMGAIDAKAKSCYAGTQGTATVKLTITNDGHVKSVSVSGAFANTPVGECVANAVRGATFPPWDGGPQSFGYNFLLSD